MVIGLFFFDLRLITTLVSSHFWSLHCLFFFDLRLITTLVYFGHYLFFFGLFLFDLRLIRFITFGHCIVCSSDLRLITTLVSSHFWSLYCLFFFDLRLITTLVSSHCSCSIFFTLLVIVDCIVIVLLRFKADYHISIFSLLVIVLLFFFDLRLITTLVSSHFWSLSVLLRFKADYHISIFSLLVIVLSVLLRFKADYHILYCLFFFDLRLITTLVSSHFSVV